MPLFSKISHKEQSKAIKNVKTRNEASPTVLRLHNAFFCEDQRNSIHEMDGI